MIIILKWWQLNSYFLDIFKQAHFEPQSVI